MISNLTLSLSSLLCLQPLDMNSVELARHNLSETLPDMNHLFRKHCPCSSCCGPEEEEEEEEEEKSGTEAQTVTSAHPVSAAVLKQRGNVAVTPQTCLCNVWFVCRGELDVDVGTLSH